MPKKCRTCVSLFLGLMLGISGCSSVDMSKQLVTLDPAYFQDPNENARDTPREISRDVSAVSDTNGSGRRAGGSAAVAPDNLERAYQQIVGRKPRIGAVPRDRDAWAPLPEYLARDALVGKLVRAAYESRSQRPGTPIKVSQDDMENFLATVIRNFGALAPDGAPAQRDNQKNVSRIIKQYLLEYYCSDVGFVDREGAVYKAPEFKGSVGNDVITALVAIVLEGTFDALLNTPVYVKGDGEQRYQTKAHKQPSVCRVKPQCVREEQLVDAGGNGIDELELRGIRFLSALAADQSKLASGAAFRAFGNLELGFVVGGDFAFGDNETLAKVLDTTFEVSSKRLVEAAAYQGFEGRTDRGGASPRARAEGGTRAAPLTQADRLIADIQAMQSQ